MSDVTVRVPLGVWRLDGRWRPNPLLRMSAEEQRRRNIENGFPCPLNETHARPSSDEAGPLGR